MVGLLVTMTTAVSVPAAYFGISALAEGEHLAFHADQNASRVARYAYQYGDLWPFHRTRIAELVEAGPGFAPNIRQRVLSADGRAVADDGGPIAGPALERTAPIVVAGREVGRVEVTVGLAPLLGRTAGVAVVSALIAAFVWFGARTFPLRALDRTLATLAARERDLADANAKLAAAVTDMPHGLSMFDADGRLVLCNGRYATLYGLPERLTRPGTSFEDIRRFRMQSGSAPLDPESLIDWYDSGGAAGMGESFDCARADGRHVRISRRAMANGGFVASHEDITEAVRAEARIAHLAHHDALTGLANRVTFRHHLDRVLAERAPAGLVAVVSLDLDRFKAVNDTLGHQAGDTLLKAVALRLRHGVAENDLIARLGGDEFAIVQAGIERPEQATAMVDRLIATVSAPYEIDGRPINVGLSAGIALAPGDGTDGEKLLRASDMALYRAKSEGRGSYRFFEPEMDLKMQARRALEMDLRDALARDEMQIVYQPLVDLRRDRVSGFEALLRWHHPVRGEVLPGEFIPLAEEIGVIGQIGGWVLRRACQDATRWPADVRLAVNLSPEQFKSPTLLLDVVAALGASGLAARRLELEITETVMLHDTEATLATLTSLRELGVRIAMDDFGTGYSSLSYLRKFPFDKIKIDQSFVRDLAGAPDDGGSDSLAIVRAVTGLAASFGMSTTAEGVETEAQLERVRAEGCSEAQGWLFSPALPAAEAEAMIGCSVATLREVA